MNNEEARSVARRFSAAADTYEVLATVQDRVGEELLGFLPPGYHPPHLLEVGCGTGLFTRQLLRRFPDAHIDALDVSDRMIARARETCAHAHKVTWFVADALRFHPSSPYPLIVSNASLHWLDSLPLGLTHLAMLLKPGGYLVFSIMVRGTLSELRESRQKAAPHKPPLRDLPEAGDVLRYVEQAGLYADASEIHDYRVFYRSAAAFLKAIHDQGLTGGTLSRSSKPLTRFEINELIMEYEWRYRDASGMVAATYKALFVRAQRPTGHQDEQIV